MFVSLIPPYKRHELVESSCEMQSTYILASTDMYLWSRVTVTFWFRVTVTFDHATVYHIIHIYKGSVHCNHLYIVFTGVTLSILINRNLYNISFLYLILYIYMFYYVLCAGGIRGTVVARYTAGQQVERSFLHQGHDSEQIYSSH